MSRKKRDKSRQAKSKRVLVPNVQRLQSSKASKQPNQLVTISSSESTSVNQTAHATDRKGYPMITKREYHVNCIKFRTSASTMVYCHLFINSWSCTPFRITDRNVD